MSQHHDVDHERDDRSFDSINMDDVLLSMDVGSKSDHHSSFDHRDEDPLLDMPSHDGPNRHRFDSPVVHVHDDTDSIQNMIYSPNSPDFWRVSNAVHMELQENAKLPTFLWNVDRSGSSHIASNKLDLLQNYSAIPNRSIRSGSIGDDLSFQGSQGTLMDHLMMDVGHQPAPINIAEVFLNVESGRHANFPTHKSGKYDSNMPSKVPNVHEFDGSELQPTPLSEIRGKHSESPESKTDSLQVQPQTLSLPNVINIPYWSRQDPLPIPTPVSLETAANVNEPSGVPLAASVPHKTTIKPVVSEATPGLKLSPAAPTVESLVTKNLATVINVPGSRLDVSSARPSMQHAAAHMVPRPALEKASLQQSQYGFGPKHVVPSVPPTKDSSKRKSSFRSSSSSRGPSNTVRINASTISSGNNHSSQASSSPCAVPSIPSSTSRDDDDSGSGGCLSGNDAYERKKLRAKSARVRLNESIDRLQIALNIAGTESRQRLTMFEEHTVPYRIIADCIQCSDDAKKWDRPSFVGSAATMIQGLNAQCEALVRALHDERHARAQHTAASTLSSDNQILKTSAVNLASRMKEAQVSHQRGRNGHIDELIDSTSMEISEGDSSAKRQRLNESMEAVDRNRTPSVHNELESSTDFFVFEEKSIMDRVASFLEPLSITRCMRVSRAWKSWSVFTDDSLWRHLAIKRFGYYNTRQWSAKLEDDDQSIALSSLILYKTMDAANVMPHFPQDGLLLLGEAKITAKVSAWTYLVERSNGETMRSVRRHTSMPGSGIYTSMPVVQLWTVIQNTGIHDDVIVLREQTLTVDTSTRRRGDEMVEIDWDDHLRKRILNLDGTVHVPHSSPINTQSIYRELCRLRLFESIILEANIHAKGCTTTSKFIQKCNFTKVLIQIRDGTTIPLVIPFPRDALHLLP